MVQRKGDLEGLLVETEPGIEPGKELHCVCEEVKKKSVFHGTFQRVCRNEVKKPRLVNLPDSRFGCKAQGDICHIGFTQVARSDESGIRMKIVCSLRLMPEFAQGETLGNIFVGRDRKLNRKAGTGDILPAFHEKIMGMRRFFGKMALPFFRRSYRVVRFVEQPADHASELFPLVPHGTLDNAVNFAGAVCRTAGRVCGADIEHPLQKLMLVTCRADVRKTAETPDHEYDVAFAVHNGTLKREINLRIGVTVDETADRRRIERLGFFRREPGKNSGLPGRVFSDADHDIPAFCVCHGETMTDELRFSGTRQLQPVLCGFVIQFIGFHSAVNDALPVDVRAHVALILP